ncbi:macro domain-containing protein [Glycomyces xiaoerkulensis]|uniref:macro domain-containing protein n=1 Tax=Glycomyces xiaoerkulensis TaxID=2038139 RepID=UPI001300016A|nr:macro domain-containing protein [Glycomyces xiaoerkulensis]
MGLHILRPIFGTRRGLSVFCSNALIAFGLVSGLVQLYTALWSGIPLAPMPLLAIMAVLAVAWGCRRAWPRTGIRSELSHPEVSVRVLVGDLFDQEAHLVVGFNDMFDTDLSSGEVIDPSSVQGQFESKVYRGNTTKLDRDLKLALDGIDPVRSETRADKPVGKLVRYPIGTIAVLGDQERRYFCLAYASMQNNLVAQSNVDYLWRSLGALWQSVHAKARLKSVAMPIVGTELARVSQLDRESILKMILLSFIAQTRERIVCRELTVMVHPSDVRQINMLEVKAFLDRV